MPNKILNAAFLFLVTVSVYSDQAIAGTPAKTASNSGTEVRLIDDGVSPTTQPIEAAPIEKNTSGVVVTDAGTVELHVSDASLSEVLRMLSAQAQKNIIASKDVHGTVTANLYDVTIHEALDGILTANGYGYVEKGNFIFVYSQKELAELQKAERKPITQVFHLYYTPAANVQPMIKTVMSPDGQFAMTTPAVNGLPSDTSSGGNSHATEDMIVVTDYPENIDAVRKLLKEIDRRPQQILVEATILSATLSEDNALGVNFQLLGGVDFSTLSGAGATASDVFTGNILNNTKATAINDHGANGVGTGFALPGGGLQVGLVTKNLAAFIAALESTTDATVLANPKVLVLNKQKGEVKVAREDPYLGTSTIAESGVSQQQIQFLETGTVLLFRPYIGDDGYIRMEIHPEDSSPLPPTSANLPPTKLTTETTTNIMVKDGHTIVIGGMFRETGQTQRDQIPVLGNLPWVGPLFRKQQDTTQREEVIVLLTPHIIKDEQTYSDASVEEMKEAEKLRVGVRQGMMPWGRERLAETAYENAVAEMNKPTPNRETALWHLNCATNLNPKFVEAIALKEKLTGKVITESDNSTIRSFVRRQILADPALPAMTPPAGVLVIPQAGPATQPAGKLTVSSQPAPRSATTAPSTQPDSADTALLRWVRQSIEANKPAPATQPAVDDGIDAIITVTPQD